ncbi:glycoside hydrolase family 20 protein [Capnocytophaga sp. oral taxon 903]|uniref:glycoside hydrolase family 20 protein n=1 Tax=Capnocytophaga sp. oral taxon 903 TaxID=2748317 RepID=UPI0015B9C9C3|nr:glycoside hydrolase family 20 protein [Capnocytophaga sp. oral taxon 903]NWO29363.1 family 20 glycosylhydrolase [Capnocytophaga sp. oral taxon 903]
MKTIKKILCISVLWVVACQSQKEAVFTMKDLAVIPQPESVVLGKGSFRFTKETVFVTAPELYPMTNSFVEQYEKATGFRMFFRKAAIQTSYILLSLDKSLPKEGYTLVVKPDKISITAADHNGALYALETLRQLLPKEFESSTPVKTDWVIPAVTISDAPQYPWRGLMLDVSRHFFPKEYILKTLDRMAMLKLNTFHFHLVDNEGWRIEIKKYPKLTEIGAWRVDQEDKLWNERTPNSANAFANPATAPKKYGGFYTQEDIKEIVAYASARGITVIPEIEMPAHAMSAIAAYPELSCHKRPIGVPSGAVWPITDIYCAGQEETFTFLEDVLTEVMELFPSKYIHVGGDEATHTEWEKCLKCQARMKDHHLKDMHQLQSYFIKRINDFLVSKGRTLVGWDEIMDGGLANNAVVMNWRGIEVGKKALEQGGNPVVLTSDCYIDNYQGLPDYEPQANGGYLPLKKLYHYSLEKENLSPALQKNILGTQANLWAENVGSTEHSEYMLFPRLLALAEISWTTDNLKNWDNFINRTQAFMKRLDVMKVNYARSMYQVVPTVENQKGNIFLKLDCEVPNADIRYALGDTPIEKATKYHQPIALNRSTTFKATVFSGKATNTITTGEVTFHKAIDKKVSYSPLYHKSYQGQGEATLTNIIRGTKNFHDGQWLGWLGDDVTLTLNLEQATEVREVRIGAMDAQASGIYFPVEFIVSLSNDGKNYREVATHNEPCVVRGKSSLKDFVLKFSPTEARYIKLTLKNVKTPPKGGDAWLFIDEILVF